MKVRSLERKVANMACKVRTEGTQPPPRWATVRSASPLPRQPQLPRLHVNATWRSAGLWWPNSCPSMPTLWTALAWLRKSASALQVEFVVDGLAVCGSGTISHAPRSVKQLAPRRDLSVSIPCLLWSLCCRQTGWGGRTDGRQSLQFLALSCPHNCRTNARRTAL